MIRRLVVAALARLALWLLQPYEPTLDQDELDAVIAKGARE